MGRKKKIKPLFIGQFCMYKEFWLLDILTLELRGKGFHGSETNHIVIVLDVKSGLIIKQFTTVTLAHVL